MEAGIPLETTIIVNAVLLLVAIIVVLAVARISVTYQRSLGEGEAQERQRNVITNLMLILIGIALLATGFNLLTA